MGQQRNLDNGTIGSKMLSNQKTIFIVLSDTET